jgi:hypothetical protein
MRNCGIIKQIFAPTLLSTVGCVAAICQEITACKVYLKKRVPRVVPRSPLLQSISLDIQELVMGWIHDVKRVASLIMPHAINKNAIKSLHNNGSITSEILKSLVQMLASVFMLINLLILRKCVSPRENQERSGAIRMLHIHGNTARITAIDTARMGTPEELACLMPQDLIQNKIFNDSMKHNRAVATGVKRLLERSITLTMLSPLFAVVTIILKTLLSRAPSVITVAKIDFQKSGLNVLAWNPRKDNLSQEYPFELPSLERIFPWI